MAIRQKDECCTVCAVLYTVLFYGISHNNNNNNSSNKDNNNHIYIMSIYGGFTMVLLMLSWLKPCGVVVGESLLEMGLLIKQK
tara:strand:- start:144 stop:392 length:249 start_codon:yes stop_codon:yes gene_type:complete